MKDKVVVIGGSGFLGSHLADALTEAGYAVSIFDGRHSPWLRPDQEMILGDIRDEEALSDCIAGARYVYHLAGISDIGEAARSPRVTVEHNIIGSTAVLQSCLQAKVERMLFASTLYVYSQQGSFYRVSKQAVELLIEAYHENFGLEEGRIHYPGTGEERREYIHVIDAARLSVEALAPDYANQCLTLTGTQILNSGELLRMIQEILGGKVEITFSPEQRNPEHYELTPYRFTPRKARKIVPNVFVDIGQGILDLVEEVYLENGPKNTND
jgi:UDP-glucose 4-epimerase